MKNKLIYILAALVLCACSDHVADTCDCLADYEITNSEPENVDPAIACLKDEGVELSIFSEETMELIGEMDTKCPKEARKLFWLLGEINNGRINP